VPRCLPTSHQPERPTGDEVRRHLSHRKVFRMESQWLVDSNYRGASRVYQDRGPSSGPLCRQHRHVLLLDRYKSTQIGSALRILAKHMEGQHCG
jgi:hypothetical protein